MDEKLKLLYNNMASVSKVLFQLPIFEVAVCEFKECNVTY